MLKRLRFKFVFTNMAIVTVMLCFIFGLIYHFTQDSMERVTRATMQAIVERPFQRGLPGEKTDNIRLPYFTLQVSRHGELVATGGGFYDMSDGDFLKDLISDVDAIGEETGVLEEYSLRYLSSYSHGDRCIVFVDTSNERATLNNLLQIFAMVGGSAFLVFLGLSVLLARWEIKPVEQAWQQQRQFIADASHELKTPLAVILTNAELLQSPDCDESGRAQFSSSILVMARQMRELVEQLLELARSDGAQGQADFAPVDLSRLVSDAVLPFEPLLYERGLTLETDIQPGITVMGLERLLRQLPEILLDNAEKYSSPGGRVRVCLQRQSRSHCLLTVANTGEAIPAEELRNIFKRFYRMDKARTSGGGFGLGLAIAESVATRHKGRIWCESREGMNSFMVELPVHSQNQQGEPPALAAHS